MSWIAEVWSRLTSSPRALAAPTGFAYRAFLSYRTTDERAVNALHTKLEHYRVPKDLVGKDGDFGPVPPTIGRVFRDREELRTAADIETVIAHELAKSHQLIVYCTPDAADPKAWVGREIELFRQRRPDGRIHAVIGGGEPPGCFPAQLLRTGADGTIEQPLAADLRAAKRGGRDDQSRALIRLIAGLIGVGFDDLWKRQQRRARQRQALAAGVFLFVLGSAWTTYAVLDARAKSSEASALNAEASGLWRQARNLANTDSLLAVHLMAEAANLATDPALRNAVLLDQVPHAYSPQLLTAWDFGAAQRGVEVVKMHGADAILVLSDEGVSRVDLAKPAPSVRMLFPSGTYAGSVFSASASRVLLWTADDHVQVFDAEGRPAGPRVNHGTRVVEGRFAPDEKAFLTTDDAGRLRLWNIEDGRLIGQTRVEPGAAKAPIERIELSRDGSRALVVTRRKEHLYETTYFVSELWDLRTKQLLASHNELLTEDQPSLGVDGRFSSDGQRLLTWRKDRAYVVDTGSGTRRLMDMPQQDEDVRGAMFGPDERRVVTWSKSLIRLWEIADKAAPRELKSLRLDESPLGVAIDDRGAVVAWAGSGRIQAWSPVDGSVMGKPLRHYSAVQDRSRSPLDSDRNDIPPLRLDRGGKRLLSWVRDASVRLWDAQTGEELAVPFSHRTPVAGAVFCSDESKVLTWSVDGVLRLWSLRPTSTTVAQTMRTAVFGEDGWSPSMAPDNLAINEDPAYRLRWNGEGVFAVWNLHEGKTVGHSAALPEVSAALRTPTGKRRSYGGPLQARVAFNMQGTRLVVYGGQEPEFSARMWDMQSSRMLVQLGRPEYVTFNREGTFFAAWSKNGALRIHRSSDGVPVSPEANLLTTSKPNPVKEVEDVVVNGPGTRVAVVYSDDGDGDPAVRIWAADQGRYLGSDINPATAMRFTPQGDRLVLWRNITRGGDSRTNPFVALVDATTGAVLSDRKVIRDDWEPDSLFDATGTLLFGSRSVWNMVKGERIRPQQRGGRVDSTGKRFAFLVSDTEVELVDGVGNGAASRILRHGAGLEEAVFAKDSVGTIGARVMKLWALKDGSALGEVQLDEEETVSGYSTSLGISAVLTWDRYARIARLRDLRSGRPVAPYMKHGDRGLLVGACYDEQMRIVMTWDDESLKLWSTPSGELLRLAVGKTTTEQLENAMFIQGRQGLLAWDRERVASLDLSAWLLADVKTLRSRLVASTGAEYDRAARQLHVLTTEEWKRRARASPAR